MNLAESDSDQKIGTWWKAEFFAALDWEGFFLPTFTIKQIN